MPDSFPDAARRHWRDANQLATGGRFQNAGHLLGFAAECFAKEVLERVGITIDTRSGFKEHFPKLADKIRLDGRTRVMVLLTPIVAKSTFLSQWQAECRYEADIIQSEAEARFNSWRADVETLFTSAGIP